PSCARRSAERRTCPTSPSIAGSASHAVPAAKWRTTSPRRRTAVEIVSPRHSVTALVRRCLSYVSNGVPLALLIDPGDRSVLAFRPGAPATSLRGADPIDFADILPGLRLTVQELVAPSVLQ